MKKAMPRTILSNKKLRATTQRICVLEQFLQSNTPLSAEDVFVKAKKRIDLVTAYRTIEQLQKCGVVRRVDVRRKSHVYEMADDHHHHIVCTDCGKIEDFDACGIEDMTKKILKNSSFGKIQTHSLELFGTCKSCTSHSLSH